MTIDRDYQMVVQQIMRGGEETETRNGKVVRSFYPFVIRCDSAPIVGWRKVNHHLGIREMDFFINDAECNLRNMDPSIRHWWEAFADEYGNLGYNYSLYYDDLGDLVDGLINKPFSRRHVLSTWNLADAIWQEGDGLLTNCHGTAIQFFVDSSKTLHLKMYQRSADVMLGLPYNLIQYWALLEYVAYQTGNKVGTYSTILGDAHIYESHWEAAEELIRQRRVPNNEARLVYSPSRS